MSSWTGRKAQTFLDGSSVFQTPRDVEQQQAVARELERCWNCRIVPFEPFDRIDWYAARYNRMVGLLELKVRDKPCNQPDNPYEAGVVFLSVRKWFRLKNASWGLGVPAVFVVKYTDGIWFCFVDHIDARQHKIIDPRRARPGVNDIEPVILVPVASMRKLRALAEGEEPITGWWPDVD